MAAGDPIDLTTVTSLPHVEVFELHAVANTSMLITIVDDDTRPAKFNTVYIRFDTNDGKLSTASLANGAPIGTAVTPIDADQTIPIWNRRGENAPRMAMKDALSVASATGGTTGSIWVE
jgi:hypothetical protein